MIKQTNWNGKDVLLVEVPDKCKTVKMGATCPACNSVGMYNCAHPEECGGHHPAIKCYSEDNLFINSISITIGNWQFAFASPLSPTEEEAREWVGWHRIDGNVVYRDYENDDIDDYSFDCNTPIESLHSRIRSEGFEQPGRVVILTKTQTNEKV